MQVLKLVAAKLGGSTFWVFLPALFVAGAVGLVVSGYEPLMFDASAYATQAASAPKLSTTDADEVADPDAVAGTAAPAGATKTASLDASADLADGTYTGYAPCGVGNGDGWKAYYVAVTITVKGGKVASIDSISGSSTGNGKKLAWDASENQKYLTFAISGRGSSTGVKTQLDNAIAKGKLPSGVDTVSGATYSSVAIYNAFAAAVKKAAKAAGKEDAAQSQSVTASASSSSSTKAAVSVADDVSGQKLADGAWLGYAPCGVGNEDDWSPYYVAVSVQVSGGKVVSVDSITGSSTGEAGSDALNWNAAENQVYLDWAVDGRTRAGVSYTGVRAQIEAAIAAGSNPQSVDVVSGATYSSEAILQAYYAALRKAAAAAGSAVEEPSPGSSSGAGASSSADATSSTEAGDEPSSSSGGSEADDDDPGAKAYVDGSYSGKDLCGVGNDDGWSPYYIVVDIEVEDGKIASISKVYGDTGTIDPDYVYDSVENATYLNKAINGTPRKKGVKTQIQALLDAGETVKASDIDTLSSATISSKSIVAAYLDAVKNIATE